MHENMLSEPIASFEKSLGLVRDKLSGWLETSVALLPNLVVALAVLVIFVMLSKVARQLIQRFLAKVTDSQAMARLLASLGGIAVIAIGVVIALGVLKLDKTVTSLLAGAGVVGVALAFAFQDLAANLIAGVYLSFRRPFVIGDLIETHDTFGVVQSIDLRNTVIRTNDGLIVILPNKEVFENKLVNFSKCGQRRVALSVGVTYGEDLPAVRDVARQAVEALDMRLGDRDVEVYYEGFGGSSIDLVVRFWIDFDRQSQYKEALSEAIIAVKQAFDDHGIGIPFPIRTLDFGIHAGETLEAHLGAALARSAEGRRDDPGTLEHH